MSFPKMAVAGLFCLTLGVVGVRAQAHHEDYMDVYVINQTPWHVGVAIQDKSWVLEPWRGKPSFKSTGTAMSVAPTPIWWCSATNAISAVRG